MKLPNPLSILLIEDSIIMQEIVDIFLEGHHLMIAKTGEEGLHIYNTDSPDIVFLDIGLPDANGHDVLQKIKLINPEAFVIIVTGSRHATDLQGSILEGAQGYLVKPFSKTQIQECLDLYYEHIKTL